jgi:hypothetical protein
MKIHLKMKARKVKQVLFGGRCHWKGGKVKGEGEGR